MNWLEFTTLSAAMAEGRTEPNAVAVNRALNRPAMVHSAHCWQQFAHTCAATAADAPVHRPSAPSPWLPPLP